MLSTTKARNTWVEDTLEGKRDFFHSQRHLLRDKAREEHWEMKLSLECSQTTHGCRMINQRADGDELSSNRRSLSRSLTDIREIRFREQEWMTSEGPRPEYRRITCRGVFDRSTGPLKVSRVAMSSIDFMTYSGECHTEEGEKEIFFVKLKTVLFRQYFQTDNKSAHVHYFESLTGMSEPIWSKISTSSWQTSSENQTQKYQNLGLWI